VAVPVPAPVAPVAAPAGLMGWLKNLFGMSPPPAPVVAPAPAPTPAAAPASEKREGRDGERRGGRGGRGGQRGEGRGSDERRADGPGESRGGQRDGSRRNGERNDRGPRGDRQGPRDRRDAAPQDAAAVSSGESTATDMAVADARPPRGERSERGEGRRGRGGEGRRERGERTERAEGQPQDDLAATALNAAALPEGAPTQDANGDGQPAEERRERRSRDRYGRDRRERRDERAAELPGSVSADGTVAKAAPAEADAGAPRSYFARSADAAAAPAAPVAPAISEEKPVPAPAPAAPAAMPLEATAAPVAPAAPAPVASPAPRGLPRVTAFALPMGELDALAASAGLQWVNSDVDKVASVQAAIAAEPRPIHVPRERPPLVVLDDGPLVLVETRKDLRQVTLAFEAEQASAPH